jgi:hypothetical protein
MKIVRTGLIAALLLAASGAQAAPICLDRQGEMRRCGASDAMPVGWAPPPEQARERLAGRSDGLRGGELIGLTLFLGGLFALFALLPDFEGRWDGQENDEEERG